MRLDRLGRPRLLREQGDAQITAPSDIRVIEVDIRRDEPGAILPVLQALAERGSVQHMRRDSAWTPDPTSDIRSVSDAGPARAQELPAARSRGGRGR